MLPVSVLRVFKRVLLGEDFNSGVTTRMSPPNWKTWMLGVRPTKLQNILIGMYSGLRPEKLLAAKLLKALSSRRSERDHLVFTNAKIWFHH